MLQLLVQGLTQRQLQISLDDHKFNYETMLHAKNEKGNVFPSINLS